MENDFLKKILPSSIELHQVLEVTDSSLSLRHQCRLLGCYRSTFYYRPIQVSAQELDLMSAFERFGEPEYFNSDQEVQITSLKYQKLFDGHETKISMDGKGHWVDNVIIERFWWSLKYEDSYLKCYDNATELYEELTSYMKFYNEQRIHSSLSYKKPKEVYFDNDIRTKKIRCL
jgi:transposase InsO family protein